MSKPGAVPPKARLSAHTKRLMRRAEERRAEDVAGGAAGTPKCEVHPELLRSNCPCAMGELLLRGTEPDPTPLRTICGTRYGRHGLGGKCPKLWNHAGMCGDGFSGEDAPAPEEPDPAPQWQGICADPKCQCNCPDPQCSCKDDPAPAPEGPTVKSETHAFEGPAASCMFYEGGDPQAWYAYCGKPESDPIHDHRVKLHHYPTTVKIRLTEGSEPAEEQRAFVCGKPGCKSTITHAHATGPTTEKCETCALALRVGGTCVIHPPAPEPAESAEPAETCRGACSFCGTACREPR